MHANDLLRRAADWAGFAEVPADSCVVHDAGRPLTRMLASINATTGDLLLARQLGCDGYLLHHPLAGSARRNFHRVLDTRMVELIVAHGVPEEEARAAVRPLRDRSFFNDHLSDWDHLASSAAHLGIGLVNVHLPADEIGRRAMVRALRDAGITLGDAPPGDAGGVPAGTMGDAIAALRGIRELGVPENEIVSTPEDPDWPVGRVAVMHAGGTNGGLPVARALIERGWADTVLYIHSSGEAGDGIGELARRRGCGGLIVTGHLASDAIGMNGLIAMLRAEHGIEIVTHGGLMAFQPVDR